MASKKVSEEGESWEHVKWNKKLWFAADRGDNITVEECLSNGADVNYHDGWGDTILHIAAYNGHTDIVKMIISYGADINRTNYNSYKPYDVAKNSQIRELIKCQRMLNRLLGEGSYESYDMRVMVTGQCGVGKTSLVMILLGENVSKIRQSTDGISLLEGRCGLGIEGRDWILIHENDYKALDFVYNKVLMSSEDSGTHVKVPTSQQEYQEKPIHQLEDNAYVQEQQQIEPWQHRKMESKVTKEEIGKKLVQVMKTGIYTMKTGRLVFWDFGGQYVYYTTHQTFMTYRALFLVVFDGSKGLNDEVTDVVCFPGQHGTPTAAVFLQHWVNSILTYCKLTYPGIPKILFVATHKDNVPKELVCEHRKVWYSEIEDLFRHHEGRNHLVLFYID